MFSSLITYTFILFILALSPFPSIPIIILNYQKNGIIIGMICSIIAGSAASIVHFKLSIKGESLLRGFLHKIFKKSIRYKNYIKNLGIRELFFIQLSGIIPAPIISITAGLNQIKYEKFIIATILSSIFGQFIYIIATNQINIFEKYLIRLGINKIQTLYISVAVGSIIALILSILIKKISRYFYKKF